MNKNSKSIKDFDKARFIENLKNKVTKEKVVEITLRPDGISLVDLRIALGGSFVYEKLPDGKVRIGVKQTPAV